MYEVGGVIMYDIFNLISRIFNDPLTSLAYSTQNIPLLTAFILGLLGALAPCQFTANIGAVTFYGNRSFQKGISWSTVFFFIFGKIVVFTGLGLIVWIIGNEFQRQLTSYLPWIRKLLGPMLILIGVYLLGWIKLNWNVSLGKVPEKYFKNGKTGAFLMGSSFSLGFCPTMFSLFFILLMPLVLSNSYGVILPSVFAVGTSVPFLIAMFLIWYYGLNGVFMKKGRKLGFVIQRIAGGALVVLGILDTFTYWTL
jgi:cytochrome c-type biogenesis protein